jgi:uncharacterized protein (DUF2235 family)
VCTVPVKKHISKLTSERSEPPSNVTRISRVFCRTCSDGTHQIINYFPGVGTANAIDRFTGGAFGMGLDQVRLRLSA